MAEFNAAQALAEANERHAQLSEGSKLVPVSAAVIAVLAALATLLANHNSISGLAQKNEAILLQSKASDQYNYYESKRIKVHVYQALMLAGAATAAGAPKKMQAVAGTEDAAAKRILKNARALEAQSETHALQSERFMGAFENHEIGATLFETSIVLVSITALTRARTLLYLAGVATLAGLVFLIAGLAH